jgi:hypothetical protein
MTGIAKNDRKNTACPGGTVSDVALISAAIAANTAMDSSFRPIPRSGCMGEPFAFPQP